MTDTTKLQKVGNYLNDLRILKNKPTLTKRTIYNMIADGRVKSHVIDGVKFIIREDW